MVARGVLERVNEGKKTCRVQVTILGDETEDDVEVIGQYGFHISPPAGSEAVALAVGGARSHTVVVATGNPDARPKGAAENTGGVYVDGQWVLFVDANKVVHVGAETAEAFIARADYTDARVEALQKKIDDLISKYNAHIHTTTATIGTGGPGVISPTTSTETPVGAQATVAATKGKVT